MGMHQEAITCMYTLSPHRLAPYSLRAWYSSTGTASHQRCKCVGSIPAQKLWDLYTSATVYHNIFPFTTLLTTVLDTRI